jgi:hypothetical protein
MKTFIKILLVLTAIFLLSYYDHSVHGEEYEKMKRIKPYWKIGYVYIDSIHNDSFMLPTELTLSLVLITLRLLKILEKLKVET